MNLDPTQQAAIDHAVTGPRLAIITGSAGTGKTTIIAQIAARVKSPLLCAFAGKAAARLREATGHSASTIHRALGFDGEKFMTKSLRGRLVIIDEASMVSADIMAAVIRCEPDRLILVGDEAQLPPVGHGQPFHDLITQRPALVYSLSICWRQSEAVYRAATAIRNGQAPERIEQSTSERWEIRATGSAEDTHAAILDMIRDGEIDFERGTDVVLCPRNGDGSDTPCSVRGLNASIVAIVNPREDADATLLPNDRVINTKNTPDLDIWNGTTGTVHSVDQDGHVTVELDAATTEGETLVRLTKKQARSLQLAYALSVHKSQGSQYRRVIFTALERDAFMLLSRSLLYTAVTRTQKECLVIGQASAVANAIASVRGKRTVIQELCRDLPAATAAQQKHTTER